MIRILRAQAGQAQILTAAMIGVVMLSGALYSLQYVQQTSKLEVVGGKRTEMRQALDAAIRHASYLYHAQSACDPVTLDNKLARINPDGTIANPNTFTRRQMSVTISNHTYTVSFGPVTRIPWVGNGTPAVDPTVGGAAGSLTYNSGTSQDALVQVWTSYGGQMQRVEQLAALINDCTYPCSCDPVNDATCKQTVATSAQCASRSDRSVAYQRIVSASLFPDTSLSTIPGYGSWPRGCNQNRFLGDLKSTSCAPVSAAANSIDIRDLIILKNYLRSGDWAGSCSALITGTGANDACADFDRDGQVNEIDLNILEKALRGYLYWLPVHF